MVPYHSLTPSELKRFGSRLAMHVFQLTLVITHLSPFTVTTLHVDAYVVVNNDIDFVDEVGQVVQQPRGMLEALRALRDEQHVIQHMGMGMNTNANAGAPEDVQRLLTQVPPGIFDSAQPAGGWNLLCQCGWWCLQTCQI